MKPDTLIHTFLNTQFIEDASMFFRMTCLLKATRDNNMEISDSATILAETAVSFIL